MKQVVTTIVAQYTHVSRTANTGRISWRSQYDISSIELPGLSRDESEIFLNDIRAMQLHTCDEPRRNDKLSMGACGRTSR